MKQDEYLQANCVPHPLNSKFLKSLTLSRDDIAFEQYRMYYITNMTLRPLIVDSLFPVTRPHDNFRATYKFIIAFDSHMTKILMANTRAGQ